MKRILIALSATAVLLSASPQAHAWTYVLEAGRPVLPSASGILVGAQASSFDDYDPADMLDTPPQWAVNLNVYHPAGEGWTGPEGFYWWDVRAPLTGEKTWDNIYLWWGTDKWLTPEPLAFYPFSPDPPPANYRFTLYLDRVPEGVTYNGPWQWQLSSTSRTEIPERTFAPFSSETGLDGYKFHLTVAVPEPASLLAMASGLAGLRLRVLRHRRR